MSERCIELINVVGAYLMILLLHSIRAGLLRRLARPSAALAELRMISSSHSIDIRVVGNSRKKSRSEVL